MLRSLFFGFCCVLVLSVSGCGLWKKEPAFNPNAPVISKSEPVITTGRKAVVLSIHFMKEYPDACQLGVSLTNNLDIKVTNLSVRLAAYIHGNVKYDYITRNFQEVKPTESQYRELTYTQIRCDEIDFIGVTDPGRCSIGPDMNRYTTAPGDCAKFIDVALSPHIQTRKIKQVKPPPPTEPALEEDTDGGPLDGAEVTTEIGA